MQADRRQERTTSLLLLAAPRPVNAQWPGTGGGQIEEDETVKRRQFAAVEEREKSALRMHVKVGNRSHAGQYEGSRPRKQADHQENAANELNDTSCSAHGHWRCVIHRSGWEIQVLGRSVLEHQQSRHEAQQAQELRRKGLEQSHGIPQVSMVARLTGGKERSAGRVRAPPSQISASAVVMSSCRARDALRHSVAEPRRLHSRPRDVVL